MKVLITGHEGFIGKNLSETLKLDKSIEISGFEKDDSLDQLSENIKNADFIFHLAGSNNRLTIPNF